MHSVGDFVSCDSLRERFLFIHSFIHLPSLYVARSDGMPRGVAILQVRTGSFVLTLERAQHLGAGGGAATQRGDLGFGLG